MKLQESFHGNCIPLENIQFLKCDPIKQINITSTENRFLDIPNNENDSLQKDDDVMFFDMSTCYIVCSRVCGILFKKEDYM